MVSAKKRSLYILHFLAGVNFLLAIYYGFTQPLFVPILYLIQAVLIEVVVYQLEENKRWAWYAASILFILMIYVGGSWLNIILGLMGVVSLLDAKPVRFAEKKK